MKNLDKLSIEELGKVIRDAGILLAKKKTGILNSEEEKKLTLENGSIFYDEHTLDLTVSIPITIGWEPSASDGESDIYLIGWCGDPEYRIMEIATDSAKFKKAQARTTKICDKFIEKIQKLAEDKNVPESTIWELIE